MPDALDVHSVAILHKLGLTEDMVRDHVLHPHEADAAAQLGLHEAGGVTDVIEPPDSCTSSTSKACVATSTRS